MVFHFCRQPLIRRVLLTAERAMSSGVLTEYQASSAQFLCTDRPIGRCLPSTRACMLVRFYIVGAAVSQHALYISMRHIFS